MSSRSPRGFTLLEIMIVVAIIAIIAGMAAFTAQAVGARNAVQNAASDIGSLLQAARSRAESRGSDVYFVVFPTFRKSTGALTGGRGAIAVFEDANANFLSATGACTGGATVGDCGYANFQPPNIWPAPGTADRNLGVIYLDDYPQQAVKFGEETGLPNFPLPFATLTAAAMLAADGCSFCSSNRGAVRFTSEQQLVFLDNADTPSASRVAGLSLTGTRTAGSTIRYGLVGSTGLVTMVKF